jgi:hypothetical protein
MDFKEKLQRLEERRGESSAEWMAKLQNGTQGDANEEILKLAEVLADSDETMTEEIIDLVGGLELYKPYESIGDTPFFSLGLESVSDTVVKIFDRIIAFIKRWIKILNESEFKLSLHTALHSHSLENIRTTMRTTSRMHHEDTRFQVSTRIHNLSVNYRPISNAIGLINALTILKHVANAYFDTHSDKVLSQVNRVVSGVTDQRTASFLAEQMAGASPLNISKEPIFRPNDLHVESPHLMGNHRFVITDNNIASSDAADRVQGIRVKLEPSQLTPAQLPNGVNFEYFDSPMTEAVLTKCDDILRLLADSNNGPRRHARRQAMNALLAAVERVNEETQRNGIRDEAEARKVVSVLESYIAWIADPYTSFYAYTLRNVRAALNVCEANIA